MIHYARIAAAAALLCLLAGCVTTGANTRTVTTWQGWSVEGVVPALDLAAASNAAQREGRVDFRFVNASIVASACRAQPQAVQGCTVRNGRTYTVYVDSGLPDWMRELVALHESGHVGQYELGRPVVETGFGNPTVDLIRRLGG